MQMPARVAARARHLQSTLQSLLRDLHLKHADAPPLLAGEDDMTTLMLNGSSSRSIIDAVTKQLASVEHNEAGSFITTPLLYPSGSTVTVRIDSHGSEFFVTDMGLGYQEADMMGAGLTNPRHAKAVAQAAGVSFDDQELFIVKASNAQLAGSIITIANCSRDAVSISALRLGERKVADEAELLYTRLARLFSPKHVAKNVEIRGASNTPWEISNLVKIDEAQTIFEPVLNHRNSISSVATKFHDIALLDHAPARIAVVRR